MRRALVILGVILLVGAASWFGYDRFGKAKAAAAPDYETYTVARGNISATVSATGSILPEREANLSFQGTGTIAEIRAQLGQQVKAGDVLARLDTTDLNLAVHQAEIAVRQAQAQLSQLQDKPNSADLAAAQAALESAKSAYDQLLKGADKDQLAAAKSQVEQARASLQQAQAAYDKVKDNPMIGMLPQSLQLQQATIALETAEANYRVASRGANASQLAAAQAQIAQATASLDRLTRGPSAGQLEVAQAGVDQAQLSLEQAKRRLENAAITAPWDGIVTAVNMVQGTMASPSMPAFKLADTSQYHLDVQVDELDVANLAEGQPVTIEVDALPEEKLSGTVARVAPAAVTTATGGVSYNVRINIAPTASALRSGMSATANIIASARDNVLLIPNRAVQIQRDTNQMFVERLSGNVPQKVEVRLGLRTEQESEVREGLAAGDQIIIRSRTSLQKLQQSFGSGGGF